MTNVSYNCYTDKGTYVTNTPVLEQAKAIANKIGGRYRTVYTDIGDKSYTEDTVKGDKT
jgi:hypothetical protein